jgi:hypothetical protein
VETDNVRYQNAAKNLLIYYELGEAIKVLSACQVPVIVLKGAALAKTVYPEISDRPMGDIDLLIHIEDRVVAVHALENAGYRFLPEPRAPRSPFNTNFTGEATYCRLNGIHLDLHWELTPVEWLRRVLALDEEVMWRSALPLEIGEIRTLQLSPVDTLLHLCLHLAAQNFAYPTGFRDIVQVLSHYHPYPWEKFLERAAKCKMSVICYFALDVAAVSLGGLVPGEVLEVLCPPAWQNWLVRAIVEPRSGMLGHVQYNRRLSYLLHLVLCDQPRDFLKVLLWLLFPGKHWLTQRYELKGNWQSRLACIWHPFFVTWQGVLGLHELMKEKVYRR